MCRFLASSLILTHISQYLTVRLYGLWFGTMAISVLHERKRLFCTFHSFCCLVSFKEREQLLCDLQLEVTLPQLLDKIGQGVVDDR